MSAIRANNLIPIHQNYLFKESHIDGFSKQSFEKTKQNGIPIEIISHLSKLYEKVTSSLILSKEDLMALNIINDFVIKLKKTQAPSFWNGSLKNLNDAKILSIVDGLPIAPIRKILGEEFDELLHIQVKIAELCAEYVVKIRGLESTPWSIISELDLGGISRYFLYYLAENRWRSSCFMFGENDIVQAVNLHHAGQYMIFEKDLSLVKTPCIVIDVDWDMTVYFEQTSKMLLLDVIFYLGAPNLNSSDSNAVVLRSTLNPHTLQTTDFEGLHPSLSLLEPQQIEIAKTQAQQITEVFKESWAKSLKPLERKIEFFNYPASQMDWQDIEYRLLMELSQNPEANCNAIAFLAGEMDLTLTEEEFAKLTPEMIEKNQDGSIEVSPKAVVDVLLERAKAEYKGMIAEEVKSATTEQITPKLVLEDRQRKADIERKTGVKKPASKNSKKEIKTAIVPNTQTQITSEEKEQIRHVFKGHPMKAREFNKFAANLLKKKVGTSAQTQKGAHPKIHFEKGGISFHIQHGKKDNVMGVSGQKRTLRDILDIK